MGLRTLHGPQRQGATNDHERHPGFFRQTRDPIPPGRPPRVSGVHRGPRPLVQSVRERSADRQLHGRRRSAGRDDDVGTDVHVYEVARRLRLEGRASHGGLGQRVEAADLLFKECPSEVIGYNNKEMPLSKRFAQDAAAVTASYERLGKELAPLTKRTLVFEYPNAFTGDDDKTCEYTLADVQYPFAITRDESNWIQTSAEQALHGAIRTGVQRANFEYAGGVWNAFKGHGYCASASKRWVRRAEESSKLQGPTDTKETQGTIHPKPGRRHRAQQVHHQGADRRG